MTSYNDRFTGSVINPSTVSYEALTLNQAVTQLSWPIVYQENPFVVASYLSVTSNNASYVLQMPDATQTSVGQTTMVANVGANNFGVTNIEGGVIQAGITPSQVYFLILTDNSTPAGVWQTVLQGATTAPANAAALAGFGLTPLVNAKLNTYMPVTTLTEAYTVTLNDRAKLFQWEGGTANVTLPPAEDALNGFYISFNNQSTVGGVLNIVPQAGETIDGSNTFNINAQESCIFISNGTGWNSLGYGNNAIASVLVLELDVSEGGTIEITPEEAQRQIQTFYGNLTDNVIIELPNTANYYYVRNATTGAYSLTYKIAGGATNNIVPQGQQLIFYSDSTDMRLIPSVFAGSISFPNGSAAVPSISFQNDSSTGFFLNTVGNLGISAGGIIQANVNGAGLQLVNGSVANPAYTYLSDPDLGFFRSAANTQSLAGNGSIIYTASPNGLSLSIIPTRPSYNFIGNLTSGMGFTPANPSLDFHIAGTVVSTLNPTGLNVPPSSNYTIGTISTMSLVEVYSS